MIAHHALLWYWIFFSELQPWNMGHAVIIFIRNDYVELLIGTNEKSSSWTSTEVGLIYTSLIHIFQINTYTLMCLLMTSKRNFIFGYFTFLEFYFVLLSTLTLLKALNLGITVLSPHWNSVTKHILSVCLREVVLPVGSFEAEFAEYLCLQQWTNAGPSAV